MGRQGCDAILSLWTVGLSGECFNPKVGFRIGKGATTMLSLQHHWTNPSLSEDYYDASGLILYYTPKLRQYNAGVFTVGQVSLTIPPGQDSVTEQGTCTEYCSKETFSGDIHILSAYNHMHYLGIAQNFSIIRPGESPLMITNDDPYSYDSPVLNEYKTPITVHPGDELTTFCTFQSRSRSEVTTYGQGSYEEMCFVFFTFYPVENATETQCNQYGKVNLCGDYDSCDFETIFDVTNAKTKAMIDMILEHCDETGATCKASCPAAVHEMRKENACIRVNYEFIYDTYKDYAHPTMLKFLTALESCDHQEPKPTTPTSMVTPAPPMTGSASMFMDIIKHLDSRPLLQNIIMNVNYNYNQPRSNDDSAEHSAEMH